MLDVFKCRKSRFDGRPRLTVEAVLETAQEEARQQVAQFSRKRTPLTVSDERVILLSQLLVALSAGRRAPTLVEAFRAARSAT